MQKHQYYRARRSYFINLKFILENKKCALMIVIRNKNKYRKLRRVDSFFFITHFLLMQIFLGPFLITPALKIRSVKRVINFGLPDYFQTIVYVFSNGFNILSCCRTSLWRTGGTRRFSLAGNCFLLVDQGVKGPLNFNCSFFAIFFGNALKKVICKIIYKTAATATVSMLSSSFYQSYKPRSRPSLMKIRIKRFSWFHYLHPNKNKR